MAKQFVLYTLKDDRKDEDFIKWVNEYKGPFITGLSAVKRYTITSVKRAMQGRGGAPEVVDPPYKIAAVIEITSVDDYVKNQESKPYKDEFMPEFVKWVKHFLILQADEVWWDKEHT